jgi:hypothetical protein
MQNTDVIIEAVYGKNWKQKISPTSYMVSPDSSRSSLHSAQVDGMLGKKLRSK